MLKLIKVGLLITGKIGDSVKRSASTAVAQQSRVGAAVAKTNSAFANAKSARKYGLLLNDLKKKQRALDGSSERLDRGIEDVERRYNEARRAASRYGRETDEVERSTRKLGETQRRQREAFSKADIGKAVGAAGGAVIGASVYKAAEMKDEGIYLGGVQTSRDGDRQAGVQRSRRAGRAFARKTLATEREIIGIEYSFSSAGLEEDASRAGAQMAHKLAKITRGNAVQVGEIVGTTFNNLGNQMVGSADEKMTRIGNILAKTQFKYQIRDFNQLGESMKEGAGTARDYKISLAQTAAILGQLNSAGMGGGRAGTSFRAVLRSMGKASEELGFDMKRGEDGALDLIGTIDALDKSLEGLTIDERAAKLQEIFGDEGKSGLSPLLDKVAELKDGLTDIQGVADSTFVDREYAFFNESDLGKLTRLKQNLGQTAVTIGTALLPVLNAVLVPIGGLMTSIAWGVDNIPGFGLVVGVAGATLVVAGAALGAVTAGTWAWHTALAATSSGPALKMIGMARGISVGLMGIAAGGLPAATAGLSAFGVAAWSAMAPLAPFIAVGAAVAGVGLLVYKFWKPIKAFFSGLWSEIGGPVTSAFGALMKFTPIGAVVRGVGSAFRFLGKAVKWIAGLFKPVETGLDTSRAAGERFGRIIKSVFSGRIVIRSLVGTVKSVGRIFLLPLRGAKTAWAGIKAVMSWSPGRLLARTLGAGLGRIRGMLSDPRRTAAAAWAGLKTVLSWSPFELITRKWSGLPAVFKAPLSAVKTLFKDVMKSIADTLLSPIKKIGDLWDKVRGLKRGGLGGVKITTVSETKDNAPPPFDDRRPPRRPPSPPIAAIGTTVAPPSPSPSPPPVRIGSAVNDNVPAPVVKTPVINSTVVRFPKPPRGAAPATPQRAAGVKPAAAPVVNVQAPPPIVAPQGGQAAAAPAPVHHHVREGDTYHIQGVVDADQFVRELRPALDRRDQELREAEL